MSVSMAIMAHPDRARLVDGLLAQIGDVPVAWDRKGDRWETGRRALLAHDPGVRWHGVIQDDAVIPRGFASAVNNALAGVPEHSPLVLYAGRTRRWGPILAKVPPATSYLVMDRIVWGVGIIVPTVIIPQLVRYGDRVHPSRVRGHYDLRMSLWFERNRIDVYYTWPSLVDHRSGPSLVAGRNGGRQAYNFVRGRAERVRWDGGVFRL